MNAWAYMFLQIMLEQPKKSAVFLSLLKATLATKIRNCLLYAEQNKSLLKAPRMFVLPIVTGHHSVTQENSITSESLIFNFLPLDYTVAGEATISSSSFLTFLLVLKCSLPTYCLLLGYVSMSQTNNCPTSKGNLKPSS